MESQASNVGPAKSMIKLVQAKNGTMTLDDLRKYEVELHDPLSIEFRGFKLYTTDAPSSGSVTLNMLNVMEKFSPVDLRDGNLTLHRVVEAMKFAYGARMELGDPKYVGFVPSIQKEMLSDKKAEYIRRNIMDNQTQDLSIYDPTLHYTREGHGTSHIVVTDESGMAISSTTTVNLLFGAQIMTPDTGIIMCVALANGSG
jgi:gamma-glutamyltranspeptidase / glutathione hydrolase